MTAVLVRVQRSMLAHNTTSSVRVIMDYKPLVLAAKKQMCYISQGYTCVHYVLLLYNALLEQLVPFHCQSSTVAIWGRDRSR